MWNLDNYIKKQQIFMKKTNFFLVLYVQTRSFVNKKRKIIFSKKL